jgi:hypothetical protein
MSDQETILFLLRLGLVAALYLFLAQVVLVVLRDVRPAENAPAISRAASPDLGDDVDRLEVLDPAASGLTPGWRWNLRPITTIGRTPDHTIVMSDPTVSADHAVITLRRGHWWIEDLGSTNGTLVNGMLVEGAVPLNDSDVISIGQVRLRLHLASVTMPRVHG